jgi:hypothetical protein
VIPTGQVAFAIVTSTLEPTVSTSTDHWVFPFWALGLLLSILAAPILLGAILAIYFRVGWRRSYSELGWRVRLWFVRRVRNPPPERPK